MERRDAPVDASYEKRHLGAKEISVNQATSDYITSGFRRTWIDHTSELGCSADTASALLRDLDGWPRWTPGLKAIRRKSEPLRVGSSFVMVLQPKGLPPAYLPCKVLRDEPRFIEWGGGFLGGYIRHSFAIDALTANSCRVRQVEYATGWLGVLTLPIESIAYRHDKGWSVELERRYPLAVHSVS